VDAYALTAAERSLFAALAQRGQRFIVVGLSAAVVQGAPVTTQDIHLWLESPGSDGVQAAARDAGGFWIPPFGLQPPAFGGSGLERLDVVLAVHGLDDFAGEYARAADIRIDGLAVKVLPLDRIILSKRATNRPKDVAALPVLEATLRARTDASRN
jgi:hypothetical protein